MKKDPIRDQKLTSAPLESIENFDDGVLFQRAMAEVQPLPGKSITGLGLKRGAVKGSSKKEDIIWPRDLLEQSLKRGKFNYLFDADHIEGGPEQWNLLLLKKLREGDFSIQGELDLHGFSQNKARQELLRFIEDCSRKGWTCIRVVHGKGKNSREQIPVLKKLIPFWLSQKRLARYLIAYSSARPEDGGSGAIYVLLDKKKGS